jgi:hypothetical protein
VTTAGPIIVAIIALVSSPLSAQGHRSREVTQEFQREHPCPSTGLASGACPGYVKDHIIPLACGGADDPTNLQWQTVAEAKAKDKWERKGCTAVNGASSFEEDGSRPTSDEPGGIVITAAVERAARRSPRDSGGGTEPRAATHPGGATYNQPDGIISSGGGRSR